LPEIIDPIDPVFAKTSQYARFLLSENERFGLVFVKTGSINSGTSLHSILSQELSRERREQAKSSLNPNHALVLSREREGTRKIGRAASESPH
jgi:hypothetical protein